MKTLEKQPINNPEPGIQENIENKNVSFSGAQYWNCKIVIDGATLKDEFGRFVHLRGVNLTGNAKLPTNPSAACHSGTPEFYDHRNVSFIGRPFSITEAHTHFQRLNKWGLTFARLLVTWEALEHFGPGIYDEEFIDFLIEILNIAQEYGIKCFIDPHQDTWSRFTGGSGAPGWTFEVLGLNVNNFEATGAVHFHDFQDQGMGSKMIWPSNYSKLASATMFTAFFGGNEFLPNTKYQGKPVQDFLQEHYVNCYKHLIKRLQGSLAVIGIEAINEPHHGYIGMPDLTDFDLMKEMKLSNAPKPLESFALGMGACLNIEYWVKSWPFPSKKQGYRSVNQEKKTAWLPGKSCVWLDHGVWGYDNNNNPQLLKKNYFYRKRDGTLADFKNDFYVPFLEKFSLGIKSVDPSIIFLFEPIPNELPPPLKGNSEWENNSIYAPHWYDLHALFSKSFNSKVTHDIQGLSKGTRNIVQATYFGISGARKNYAFQLSNVVKHNRIVGPKPILIGECGIPMDINDRKAFSNGNYKYHTLFMDAVIQGLEKNLLHFTLWNYNPNNDHFYGDMWNGEDFSIFTTSIPGNDSSSKTVQNYEEGTLKTRDNVLLKCICEDSVSDHHIGGRSLDAVIRPYASKVAGKTIASLFLLESLTYELVFVTSKKASAILDNGYTAQTTEIFIPSFHYGACGPPNIVVSDGKWDYNGQKQTLYWTIDLAEQTPSPLSIDSPKWIAATKDVLTRELLESYNFHTIQISAVENQKCKAKVSKRIETRNMYLCNIF